MRSLKLSKEDALIRSKLRRLIRGTVEDSGGNVPIVSATGSSGYPGIKGRKTVVVKAVKMRHRIWRSNSWSRYRHNSKTNNSIVFKLGA